MGNRQTRTDQGCYRYLRCRETEEIPSRGHRRCNAGRAMSVGCGVQSATGPGIPKVRADFGCPSAFPVTAGLADQSTCRCGGYEARRSLFGHSLTGRRTMKVREFEAAIAYLGDLAGKENASALQTCRLMHLQSLCKPHSRLPGSSYFPNDRNIVVFADMRCVSQAALTRSRSRASRASM